jgi:ATP-dependent DNA helicase DinG
MPPADKIGIFALTPSANGAVLCEKDGSGRHADKREAAAIFRSGNVLVAHAAFIAGRLKTQPLAPLFDVLELFAFVHPAQPCVPSAGGIAAALGLPLPKSDEDRAADLWRCAERLLADLAAKPEDEKSLLRPLVATLKKAPWRWADSVENAIGAHEKKLPPLAGFEVWKRLEKWEDEPLPGAPSAQPVTPEEARARLARLIGDGETRPEQMSFADAATYAFGPRERKSAPKIALIEAGTGIGKTLGYLAPASLWAEKNGPGLWISTYTRNLQRQILQEISKLYPDPVKRAEMAVVRKGRENYLCLLNFEEAAKRSALIAGPRLVALALIARWVGATADGDMSGAGFPAFLAATLPLREISDRRGECVYGGCAHYRTCFIEKAVRHSRRAPIVIANHALVIARSATDGEDSEGAPPRSRYVFDEGHHLFDAADSGFCASISGREMADLRRWLRGPEARISRARGLEERLKDFVADDDAAREVLEEAIAAAGALAGEGFMGRLAAPRGSGEVFLAAVYSHVVARSETGDGYYSLEAETQPAGEDLLDAAEHLQRGLKRIAEPLARLAKRLRTRLDEQADELDPGMRGRIESHARGLERRARDLLPAWIGMLDALTSGEVVEDFADWFEIVRDDGRNVDAGMERHWIDPTQPLADEVLLKAHGALITSATLRDAESGDDWQSAELRTGATHLPEPPKRMNLGSPFAYGDQARIFVVKDVERRDPAQLAAAFRELFLAAGGGALGLFTAIRALKTVEAKIREPLASASLTLYAQHIDRLDTGALVDLFRAEENSCLLGTDALRDGVDVPGRSLRLVVFDKVPWPKPTILHKARRARFGKGYDDLITRFRLKQAFGRLIRSKTDKGCFVILEGATPSRLLSALPAETPILRCGLAEAVREIREFLGDHPPALPPAAGDDFGAED